MAPQGKKAMQLSVISICDATLKDTYLIRKAVAALNHCDVEQKIHLKSTPVGMNLDIILTIMSQDRASRKLQYSPILQCPLYLITL